MLGILTKLFAPKLPNANPDLDAVKTRAAGVADDAKKELDAARDRETNPGTIVASTADPTVVGPAPIRSGETVDKVGPTHAPAEVTVDPVMATQVFTPTSVQDIGDKIAGGGVNDAVEAGTQNWQVNRQGTGYQNDAALALQNMVAGKNSVAEGMLAADRDRAAAEQLSQAAGARGQNVAGARRNAAINTSLANVEYGGQMAQLRAKEIADAATGLANVGGTMQQQSLQETTSKSQLDQQVELQNTQAKDAAIQASRERFAKGEITQAQLDTDIAKTNADYLQRTNELNNKNDVTLKMDHAHQQLTADLASDDRLQQSFLLEAQLKDKAAAGNQQAILDLQKLQATMDTQIKEFNANQIQTATGQNIQNRLRALQLDDTFVESMTQAFQNAEAHQDNVALDAIRIKLNQAVQQAQMNESWKAGFMKELSMASSVASGATVPGGAGAAGGGGSGSGAGVDPSGSGFGFGVGSDVRVKEGIQKISPEDMDAFLLSVGTPSTWKYKDPEEHGEGTFFGNMAQDVASSKLGKHAVKPDDKGVLRLDMQRLAALALAGVGRLHQRVEKIEGKKPSQGPDIAGFLKARGKLS